MSGAGKVSAGVLPFRLRGPALQVLIVHPGGPLWASKDLGAWSIAKGELEPGELPLAAAIRELAEETGWTIGLPLAPLGTATLKSGKVIHAFAGVLDVDPATLRSGTFPIEWPRGSGLIRRFPEVDRAAWCDPADAVRRLNPAQAVFVERLVAWIAAARAGGVP